MTTEARRVDRAVQSHFGIMLITRRGVPLASLLIPRDRQLEEEALVREEVATACRVRSHKIVERRIPLAEVEPAIRDAVAMAGGGELHRIEMFYASARTRHGGLGVIGGDLRMAAAACRAAHKRG